jgi:hypothetical protein
MRSSRAAKIVDQRISVIDADAIAFVVVAA